MIKFASIQITRAFNKQRIRVMKQLGKSDAKDQKEYRKLKNTGKPF